MKKTLLLIGLVLLTCAGAGSSFAQVVGPIVGNASFLQWDYVTGAAEDEFRIYCAATPGVVPSATPVASVASPTLTWAVTGLSGQQYCIVTAFDTATSVESLPSNELAFFVFPSPTNFRITP